VVQVELEDLVLGKGPLDLPGHTDLHDLPAKRLLRKGELLRKEVARQLHGKGTTTLRHTTPLQVARDGAEHPAGIDPVVPVELTVLDGKERLREVIRHGIEGDDPPVHRGQGGECLSVDVEELGSLRLELGEVRDRRAPAERTRGVPHPEEEEEAEPERNDEHPPDPLPASGGARLPPRGRAVHRAD